MLVLPGISVWALFMLGDIAMRDILTESVAGTLRRQLSGPVHAWQLVLGKALYTAVLASISLVLLSAIGWLASEGGIDLLGFAVLSLALVLAVTGFSATAYGLARTERQGATFAGIIMMVFAFLGGAFFQVESLPALAQRLAPLSPFYWGTQGYQELIRNGTGLSAILPNAGVLAGVGAVLLFAGAFLLERKLVRGAAG